MKKDQAKKIVENFIRKEVRKNLNESVENKQFSIVMSSLIRLINDRSIDKEDLQILRNVRGELEKTILFSNWNPK